MSHAVVMFSEESIDKMGIWLAAGNEASKTNISLIKADQTEESAVRGVFSHPRGRITRCCLLSQSHLRVRSSQLIIQMFNLLF